MSEFSLSLNKTSTTQFSSLLLSDFVLFCSFIVSHPLYFSYCIFFSPYLFKLLSFLSPLFITTSLLLLALVTNIVHDNSLMDLPESKVSFCVTTCHKLLESLRSKAVDEYEDFQCFVELEAYKIVFETCAFETGAGPDGNLEPEAKEKCPAATCDAMVDRCSSNDSFGTGVSEVLNDELEDYQFEISRPEINQLMAGVKRLERFLQEKEGPEDSLCGNGSKEVKLSCEDESNAMSNGRKSEAKVSADDDFTGGGGGGGGRGEPPSRLMLNSHRLRASFRSSADSTEADHYYQSADNSPTMGSNLGSFGSMRKEREWRRTLACKLFEERHNVNGSEGMDLLWETYETDSSLNKVQQSKSNTKKKKKSGSSRSSRSSNEYCNHDNNDKVEEEEEEEEINDNGQFCCLQALKFSAGKMNLGMGRPNLVKISKALKGIGWLHHVSRHGKKLYH